MKVPEGAVAFVTEDGYIFYRTDTGWESAGGDCYRTDADGFPLAFDHSDWPLTAWVNYDFYTTAELVAAGLPRTLESARDEGL